MRIRDWSSDVCSSDLIAILMGAASHNGFRCEPLWSERMLAALPLSHPLAERDVVHWTDLRGERFLLPAADPGPEIRDVLLGDRKSGGEGKRVSGRVDHGGRRISQKKIKKKHRH